MSADPILKELYPTAALETQPEALSPEETFIQKVSSALDEQEIDFDALTEQEKDDVIQSALDQEQAEGAPQEGAQQEGEPTEEATKEAEAKFVEADTMGRVMAHSFNQELGELQKESAESPTEVAKAKEIMKATKQKARGLLGQARVAGGKARAVAGRTAKQVGAHVAKRKAPYLAGAGAALGAGGAGYALGKKSADEQFEAAVSDATAERLAEVLTELGVDPDQI